jgi:competence protein ComGC
VARSRTDDGFSLVELAVVVLIMGLLIAIAVASYAAVSGSSRRVACLSNQRVVMTAIGQYQEQHAGALPPSLADVQSYTSWTNGYARCVSTGAAFTYDPATGDVRCPTAGHEFGSP